MKPDDSTEPDDDQADILETLSVLRQIKSPTGATVRYRTIVDLELALLPAARAPATPWWKRSVRVPLPVAVAASIFVLFSTWTAQMSRQNDSIATPDVQRQPPLTNSDDTHPDSEPSRTSPQEPYELAISVSSTYLCGVGPLSTETRYVIKESGQ